MELNNELCKMKEKNSLEISSIRKDFRSRIKSLKYDLGKKGKEIIRLREQINPTMDEIDEPPSAEIFHVDIEVNLDPADNHLLENSFCNHTPQCIVRQPRPPPLPGITHLRDDFSEYHEHMLIKGRVPSAYGCHESCLKSSVKNYGCNSCVWFKWHGQQFGFPDINPEVYKKYIDIT